MGWPVTAQPKLHTMYADKRLGHGRGLQLLARGWCRLFGHDWTTWRYEWPEGDFTDDFEVLRAVEFGPTPDEPLLWYRGCRRQCGTVQHTTLPLRREQELPT